MRALLFCIVLWLPSAAAAADDEAALRQLKLVDWPRAYREQDPVLLARILAPEFQMIDAEGKVSTRADELAWVRANAPSYDRFEYTIERLEVFDNGSAIVAGRGQVEGGEPAVRWRTTYRSTNVLLRRDGGWVAVASHVSGVQRRSLGDGEAK